MSKSVKVEICLVNGDWQWLGKLTEEQLTLLCKIADGLSDLGDGDE
jgi:hypothetical protein